MKKIKDSEKDIYLKCLESGVALQVFKQVESLVNKYSHRDYSFRVFPILGGAICIRVEESSSSKIQCQISKCLHVEEIKRYRELEMIIDTIIRNLIEKINQSRLVKEKTK